MHASRSVETLLPRSTAADSKITDSNAKNVRAGLAGIIDPNDEELLLSKFADESAGIPRR